MGRLRVVLEIGSKWGSWTVVGPSEPGPGPTRQRCRCNCGVEKTQRVYSIRKGFSTQCHSCKARKHGEGAPGRLSVEFRTWSAMLARCQPGHRDAKDYYDRGIRVCEEWRGPAGFECFLAHVGRRPSLKHSLDRVDNSKGYGPDNVRWATWKQQHRNRRSNRLIEIDGKVLCVAEWAERSGVDSRTILARLNRGWDPRQAVFDPPRR